MLTVKFARTTYQARDLDAAMSWLRGAAQVWRSQHPGKAWPKMSIGTAELERPTARPQLEV